MEEIKALQVNSRNANQELAMLSLYAVLMQTRAGKEIDVQSLIEDVTGLPYEKADYFIKAIVIKSIKNMNSIIEILEKHMNRWTFDRLNMVTQAILLLSYTHFFYVEENVDKKIVINVAVKLAKAYLEENDFKFVNGILDSVLKR